VVTETVTIVIRERGAAVTSRGIRRVGTSARGASEGVRLLSTALIGLTAAFGIRELIQFADGATLIQNRIKVSTNSVEAYNAVLVRLREISNGTRTNLQANAELFQRLNTATRDLGTSQTDVLEVVEGLNAAIAVSGTTSTEAASGVLQLAQGLASGKFAGDELRSVIENLNPLAQRLADELGVTVGELREMGAEGKLNAEIVFPALQRAVRGFREQLDGIQFTTEQTFNVLKTETTIAVGAINQVLEASGFLNDGILILADNVGNIMVKAFAFFVEITGEAIRAGAGLLEVLGELGVILPSLGQILGVVADGFLLFFRSIDTGFQAIRTGIAATRAGILSIGEALGVVDAATTTEAFNDFADAQNDLITSSERTNETIQELGREFTEIAKTGSPADAAAKRFRALASQTDDLAASLRQLTADGKITIPEFTGEGAGPVDVDVLDAPRKGITGTAEKEGNEFGKIFGETASNAFSGVFTGEGIDIFGALAETGSQLVGDAMNDVFEELGNSLGSILQKSLDGLGIGQLSGALGAALGAGLGFLAGSLQGTTSNVRNDIAQSAVTSTQAVRGVVAGPTSIPVFEVGRAIDDAFQGTNSILLQILDQLRINGQSISVAALAPGGSAAAQELATTTPSLA
jgi:tape measure domain-containing protein